MFRRAVVGVFFVAVSATPVLAQPGNPNQNFVKPVLEAAYPMEIKVRAEAGDLKIMLVGTNLEVDPGNTLWNPREQFLYVRHSAKGSDWHNLYCNLRGDDGYPNGEKPAGSVNFVWSGSLVATLPLATWASTPGYLEFKFVKGQLVPDREWGFVFKPKIESEILRVPVKDTVAETSRITFVSPDSYLVNQQIATLLTVQGFWAPGSILLLDGKPMAMRSVNSLTEIQADLPPEFLSMPGKHTLVVRDPQPSYGYTRDLWVHGPLKILETQPKMVKAGTGAFNLVVTCDTSLSPDQVDGRVSYILSAADTAAKPADAAAKPVGGTAVLPKDGTLGLRVVEAKPAAAPPPAAGSAAAKPWTSLAFQMKGKGELWIKIPPEWAKQEGTIRVRVTTKAGEAEVSVPIKK